VHPPVGSSPTGFAIGPHVFYVSNDADSHINELWWDGSSWRYDPRDLTKKTGALAASGNPSAFVLPYDNTTHVMYLAEPGFKPHDVCELRWEKTTGWQFDNLTAATAGAPQSNGGGVSGYAFDTRHVVYRADDRHVHELWFDKASQKWNHNDLTNAAIEGAPENCGSDPFGFVAGGTQRVVYMGTDDHIHELWWDIAGWHYYPGDLTVDSLDPATGAPGAPLPLSLPTGYDFGGPHIVYVGAPLGGDPSVDSNVFELYRR
jgi:hypothetical protein